MSYQAEPGLYLFHCYHPSNTLNGNAPMFYPPDNANYTYSELVSERRYTQITDQGNIYWNNTHVYCYVFVTSATTIKCKYNWQSGYLYKCV